MNIEAGSTRGLYETGSGRGLYEGPSDRGFDTIGTRGYK